MDSKGFTLLEVTLVTAMIGLVGAMAVPNMRTGVDASRVRNEMRKVGDALTKARTLARSTLHCVTVEALTAQIRITSYAVCSPLSGVVSVETIPLDYSVNVAPFSTGNPLTFLQNGGTDAPAPSVLVASHPSGSQMQFTVMPAIGTVRAQ